MRTFYASNIIFYVLFLCGARSSFILTNCQTFFFLFVVVVVVVIVVVAWLGLLALPCLIHQCLGTVESRRDGNYERMELQVKPNL